MVWSEYTRLCRVIRRFRMGKIIPEGVVMDNHEQNLTDKEQTKPVSFLLKRREGGSPK